MFAQIVKGPDDFQKRIGCTLPDTFIVVRKEGDELKCARLDEGQELELGRSEEGSNGVCSDLLLNGDSTVNIHHLVEIEVLDLNRGIAVGISLVRDSDGIGRR